MPSGAEGQLLPIESYAGRMKRTDKERLDVLRRYRPEGASLAPMTADEATRYVNDADKAERPWLRLAPYAKPGSQLVIASFERGQGHAVERHEGGTTPEQTDRRVRRLEDPAIARDAERIPGKDKYKAPGKLHNCGLYATRISDPDAFAVCAAAVVEHADARAVLDHPYDDHRVGPVDIPLEKLLGPEGYKYCDGHALAPIDGSLDLAVEQREEWIKSMRDNTKCRVPEPRSVQLSREDFKDSFVRVFFRPTRDRRAWEIATMYVEPKPPGGGT